MKSLSFFQKPGFLSAQKYLLVSAKARVFEKTRSFLYIFKSLSFFQKPGFLTAQKYLLVSAKTRIF